MLVELLVTAGVALLDHSTCGGTVVPGGKAIMGVGCAAPSGPGGVAVTDSFYFVRQPLAGNGSITVRMASLTSPGRARRGYSRGPRPGSSSPPAPGRGPPTPP